jgi:endoglucanase
VVIVGTPFWSQHVHLALEQPIIEHKNVMYTLHFYAAEHKEETRRNAQLALDGGLPIFVTEWGTCNYSVDGPVDLESSTAWVNWMNTHGISWVNWSLSNKDESSSLLLPSAPLSGPWTVEDFSASGRYVRSLLLTTPGGTERRASAGGE